MSIFDTIRTSCREVMRQAQSVELRYDNLPAYLEMYRRIQLEPLFHTEEHHYLHHGTDTLAFFLILDAINFGSGYFPYIAKEPASSGYFTVAKRLTDFVNAHGMPSPQALRTLDPQSCSRIFGQHPAPHPLAAELMTLFARALNDLGELLIRDYQGRYEDFFAGHGGKAEDLVKRLLRMPLFNDMAQYRGKDVYFLKRAQILVQDIQIAEPLLPEVQFEDIGELTAFADNLIPYVLRCDGFLFLTPEVERKIEAGEEIDAGSEAEIELRAATIVAVEAITAFLKEETRAELSDRHVDHMLWYRGQELKKLSPLKRHRTRSVFY